MNDALPGSAANSAGRLALAVIVCTLLGAPVAFVLAVVNGFLGPFATFLLPGTLVAMLGYTAMYTFNLRDSGNPNHHALVGFLLPLVAFAPFLIAGKFVLVILAIGAIGGAISLVFRQIALFGIRNPRLLVVPALAVAAILALLADPFARATFFGERQTVDQGEYLGMRIGQKTEDAASVLRSRGFEQARINDEDCYHSERYSAVICLVSRDGNVASIGSNFCPVCP